MDFRHPNQLSPLWPNVAVPSVPPER